MSPKILRLIWEATLDTLWMVAVAASLATLFGLRLGVFLATSGRGELSSPKGYGADQAGTRFRPCVPAAS